MKVYIKNMVCNRCIMAVDAELRLLGLNPLSVGLGEAEIGGEMDGEVKERLSGRLSALGFELLDDKKSRLVEKIKTLLVDLVQNQDGQLKTNLSDYLSVELRHDYSYLSNLFSDESGTTVEKFFIAQKIERVKEWLSYDELSLSEIAYRLHYSSTAHLSSQFKKVTGLSPSGFKQIGTGRRRLDEV